MCEPFILQKLRAVKLRVWLGVVLFTGSFGTYILRYDQPHIYETHQSNHDPVCVKNLTSEGLIDNPMRLETKRIQDLLRAAYSIGFIPTALGSGWIVEWYGARYVVCAALVLGAISCILLPVLAEIHWIFTFFLRIITGINSSIYYPASQHLIAQWSPVEERGRFYASTSAYSITLFFTHNFSTLVSFRYGWKIYYYVMASIALAIAALWAYVIEENPADSTRITEEERDELLEATAEFIDRRRVVPPYMKLISNISFWALVVAHTCFIAAIWSYTAVIVTYFTTLLGYKSLNYTLAVSFAGVVRFCSSVFFGWVSDTARKKGAVSLRTIRNLHVLCSALLFCITTVHCRPILIVALTYLYGFFNGAVVGGHFQNDMDLAPNFVATQYGLMQGMAQLFGFMMSVIKTDITKNRYLVSEWNNYIKIWSITYAFSGVFFMVFGGVSIEGLNIKNVRKAKEYTTRGSVMSQALIRRRVATI